MSSVNRLILTRLASHMECPYPSKYQKSLLLDQVTVHSKLGLHAGQKLTRCAMTKIQLANTQIATITMKTARIQTGTTAIITNNVKEPEPMILNTPLSSGLTAGKTLHLCATMKILMVTTPAATTTERIAKIRIGTIATKIKSVAMISLTPMEVMKTLRTGSNAIKLPTTHAELVIPNTTTATGRTRAARIHGGTTATGMVRAATISPICQMTQMKTTSMDTSLDTPTAIPMA